MCGAAEPPPNFINARMYVRTDTHACAHVLERARMRSSGLLPLAYLFSYEMLTYINF